MRRYVSRKPRHKTASHYPVGKDDEGRSLCRWCKGPIPPGRRTLCSQGCVHELSMRTNPAYARALVLKRDHGVCSECGLDTTRAAAALAKVERFFWALQTPSNWKAQAGGPLMWRARAALRDSVIAGGAVDARGHWWEADHVVAVEDGGGELGLENLRTLCLRCHKRRSREQAAARARRRAAARTVLA